MASKRITQATSTPPAGVNITEKVEKSELADIKSSIQALREDILLSRENAQKEFAMVKEALNQANANINQVNVEMKEIKELVGKNEQRIQKMEEKSQRYEEKFEELMLVDIRQEKMAISFEAEHAEFYLRFQNLPEEKEEKLQEIVAEMLAVALEEDKERILNDIDEAFRVNTRFAMRHNLPREVHVRFIKKSRRAIILQKSKITKLQYKGKEITVLKQVPKKVRDLRKEYQFLSKKLHERGINFRWLIPEGILLSWQGQRYRLDSIMKAEAFYNSKLRPEQESRKDIREQEFTQREEGLRLLSEDDLLGIAAGGDQALQDQRSLAESIASWEIKEQRKQDEREREYREKIMTRSATEKQKPQIEDNKKI